MDNATFMRILFMARRRRPKEVVNIYKPKTILLFTYFDSLPFYHCHIHVHLPPYASNAKLELNSQPFYFCSAKSASADDSLKYDIIVSFDL